MKNTKLAGIVPIAILLVLLAWVWLSPEGSRPAPQFSAKALLGQTVDLDALRGKPVLVNFWATTCPGCVKEMPHLAELYAKYGKSGFQLIGVAMDYDPPQQVVELVRRKQIQYPIVLDTTGSIAKSFGNVRLTPTSFLIAPNGNIVTHRIGEMDIPQLERQIQSMLEQQS